MKPGPLVALAGPAGGEGGGRPLGSPAVGVIVEGPLEGARVRGGQAFGVLRVLDRRHPLFAPEGVDGFAEGVPGDRGERSVQYGTELFRVVPIQAPGVADGMEQPGESAVAAGAGIVRTPIHGVFYGRPTPTAPPFAPLGSEVAEGQTLALIEVMKTFHPLRYGGPGLPGRARVVSVEAREGAEVSPGQVLFRLEPVGPGA